MFKNYSSFRIFKGNYKIKILSNLYIYKYVTLQSNKRKLISTYTDKIYRIIMKAKRKL